ncbi:MAG: response regulator [Candidatus Poseidoniaceae archaeon]|nr:response regulator [Candidatus Poseidoniaceae archaeon]
MIHMAYVTAADEDSAPTVLIVDNNPMSTRRLTEVFRVKEFHVVVCEDGDQAVDEYIRLDPELVVIALDIPTLDGHLAALEMREHGGEGRIVFITPRRLADLARDASHSAGAVAWLEKPVSSAALDEIWEQVLGQIPEAPGLEDLDELYPEDRIKPQPDEGLMPLPPLPGMPPLPLPLPVPEALPVADLEVSSEISVPTTEVASEESPKRKGTAKWILLVLVIAGAAYYWSEFGSPI